MFGQVVSFTDEKQLILKLVLKDWKKEDVSNLNITFQNEEGKCKLTLHHTNIPITDSSGNKFEKGKLETIWRETFINRIGVMFGSTKLF
jgi:activator of HSP90 ATPase